MQSLAEMIADHPFLKGLDSKYLGFLSGCSSPVKFDSGTHIFDEGDASSTFYLIQEGLVALQVLHPGRGPVNIENLGKGTVLGWSWLIPPYKKRFGARVVEPVTAIAVDGACVRKKCEEDPKFGYEILKRFAAVMGDRLQAARLRLVNRTGEY